MVSVIVPAFNAGDCLPKLIECVESQTFMDYELIIVDDGSTDETSKICEEKAEMNLRIHVFRQSNSGVAAARNTGIQLSRGEYVAFLDADDRVPENYLSELVAACEKEQAAAAVCDVAVLDDSKERLRFSIPEKTISSQEALNYLLSRKGINSGPCGKLFRRTAIGNTTFPPLRAYEDILFVKDVFCNCARVAVTNKTAYYYLQNSEGAMGSFNENPSLDVIKATDELLSFVESREDIKPLGYYITASHLMQYVQLIEEQYPSNTEFVQSAVKLYGRHRKSVLSCRAFPWKEKLVYLAFSFGYYYSNKRFVKV